MTADDVRTRVAVISMTDATERRARFAERAREADLAWEFFPAMTSLHPALRYSEEEAIVSKGRPLRAGELGCYSSHYAVWQQVQAGTDDQWIVLEDDVIADWAFLHKLARIDFAAVGIDYLRLYYKWPSRYRVLQTNFIEHARSLVRLSGTAYGTQAYLITRAGAARLLDHCRIVKRPIDDEMDRSWAHGLPNLALFPFPVIEESSQTTIGNARFEGFDVPEHLKLRRLFSRKLERWRLRAARVAQHFQRI